MSGTRSSKTVDNVEYLFNTLGGLVYRQEWDGKSIDFLYDGENQPYAMRYKASASAATDTYYYLLNMKGDVMGLMNSSAAIAALYEYDPWGKVTVENPNGTTNTSASFIGNINPLRYRGYYYDSESASEPLQWPQVLRLL